MTDQKLCDYRWEGHADHYRDVMTRGGIPQVAFGNWMQKELGAFGHSKTNYRIC